MKMADCGSDVEFKNDKHCAYDENNWRLTLTTISLQRFNDVHTTRQVCRPAEKTAGKKNYMTEKTFGYIYAN